MTQGNQYQFYRLLKPVKNILKLLHQRQEIHWEELKDIVENHMGVSNRRFVTIMNWMDEEEIIQKHWLGEVSFVSLTPTPTEYKNQIVDLNNEIETLERKVFVLTQSSSNK